MLIWINEEANNFNRYGRGFGWFWKIFFREVKKNNWEIKKEFREMHLKIVDDNSKEKFLSIVAKKGFYLNLEPVVGAIKAVKEIWENEKFEVFFCTSRLVKYENCVIEKYKWIEKYFGFEASKKIILTRDKTLVRGDYLIDDKPEIFGAVKNPEWEHVYFTQTYNENLKGRRIDNWKNWKKILD